MLVDMIAKVSSNNIFFILLVFVRFVLLDLIVVIIHIAAVAEQRYKENKIWSEF